jgi:hypothetical protein
MEGREVVEHPSLKDLPFKIDTDKWGKIMMAPASYAQGVYRGRISKTLGNLAEEGEVCAECPIEASDFQSSGGIGKKRDFRGIPRAHRGRLTGRRAYRGQRLGGSMDPHYLKLAAKDSIPLSLFGP